MPTLVVPVTTNFSAAVLAGIDIIDFTNLIATTATATFASTQFNNVAILNLALIDGSAGVNNIVINGGSVNVSQWTFANWTTGTDTIRLNGSSANDIISGSNRDDIIDGGQGADTLIGGGGDDIFDYSALELLAGESIQGGAGAGDTLRLNQAAGTYAFSTNAALLTGMERIEFNSTNTVSAEFTGAQMAQFVTVAGGAGADTLRIVGAADLSALAFATWSANDSIRLLGTAAGETMTGTGISDFFNGGAGNDILNGGLGDDKFNYASAADVAGAGEQINGGGGAGDRIELANTGGIQLNAATIIDVEILDFLSGASTANLQSGQIGSAAGRINIVDGSAGTDALVVSGQGVSISGVTFTNWTDGVDTITINGSNAASNSLVGSDLKDTINGGALGDFINGLGGVDILNGGAGDDDFAFNTAVSIEAGEQINGGADFDRIRVSTFNTLETFDFSGASVTGVEALRFEGSGGSLVTLLSSQVGAGKINEIQFIGGGANNVSILGTADLSLLTVSGTFSFQDSITITGTAGADTITGSSVRDIIEGGDGADTLNGGGGDDRFLLNDAFHFDIGETIDGGAGLGDTLVLNTGSNGNNYNAANLTNVERLEFGASGGRGFFADANFGLAAGRINAVTGSALTDRITIQGATINLTGVAFTSWTNGTDELLLAGTQGTDIIIGSSQDDSFNPNEGADTLIGGLGNDTFNFNSVSLAVGDSIDGGGGVGDRIRLGFSSNDFTNVVIAGIEFIDIFNANATLSGTQIGAGAIANVTGSNGVVGRLTVNGAAVNLSGVTFTDWLAGEDIVNVNGTSSVDVLIGSSQRDIIQSGIGADQLFGFGGNDELYGGNDADYMSGGDGADYMSGGAAKDVFFGGEGVDTMLGGAGDDEFYVSAADLSDIIVEYAGEGNDRIFASVSYSLAANAEIETLGTDSNAGTASVNLTASNLANVVIGNNGTNVLDGRGGNDILFGLGGTDFFTFSTAPNAASNIDTIADFVSADDVIFLDDAAFSGMNAGFLAANGFLSGAGLTAAATATQHVIHNSTTGDLFYDVDGAGGAASFRFANIGAATSVASFDFFGI